jgi:hypothetical protein
VVVSRHTVDIYLPLYVLRFLSLSPDLATIINLMGLYFGILGWLYSNIHNHRLHHKQQQLNITTCFGLMNRYQVRSSHNKHIHSHTTAKKLTTMQ